MKIRMLSDLQPDLDIPEWLRSAPVSIPYFDGLELTFTLDSLEESDERDVTTAIESFLGLAPEDRLRASPYVYTSYRRIAELVGDELDCRIDSVRNVWKLVRPAEIFVSRRQRRDRAIYVQITANCDWDREHGFQIVYRRGSELSRVSEFDGHLTHADAYGLPEDQDAIV